jgi:thiamine pyrophosphate-dependent acetolactate synthase large subunit-like protein
VSAAVGEAFRIAATAHHGPVFVDFSLEALFGEAAVRPAAAARRASQAAPGSSSWRRRHPPPNPPTWT